MKQPVFSFAATVALLVTSGASTAEPAATPVRRVLGLDKGHAAIVNDAGVVEWEYPAGGELHDVWQLPKGNVLLTVGPATIAEVTPDKKVVWKYQSKPKPGYNGR